MKEIPDYVRRPPVPVPQGRPLLPDNSQSRWWWACQSARRTTGIHVPDLVTRPSDHDQRCPENRKHCKYYVQVRTSLYCSNCQVFLCGGACWHAWHSFTELGQRRCCERRRSLKTMNEGVRPLFHCSPALDE
jgi:hypothetical protein